MQHSNTPATMTNDQSPDTTVVTAPAFFEFPMTYEVTGEICPPAWGRRENAKKRIACKNKLDLLAKKARAEMKRVAKTGPDACTDEQSN